MDIEFLEIIEKYLKQETEAHLAAVVSERTPSSNLKMGDKILITDEEIYFNCEVSDKFETELKDQITSAIEKNSQGLLSLRISGEEVEFYLKSLQARPTLYIFGAGHVSSPLARIANMAGFEVRVIDDREDLITEERFPARTKFYKQPYKEFLQDFSTKPQDYIVIVTPGHKHDYEVIKNVIEQEWRYLGMIGSTHKVNLIFAELKEDTGVEESRLRQVDAPIGIDIGSETPEEIAISIAAALISARRCKN